MSRQDIARAVVERHGITYAQQAGTQLEDAPASFVPCRSGYPHARR